MAFFLAGCCCCRFPQSNSNDEVFETPENNNTSAPVSVDVDVKKETSISQYQLVSVAHGTQPSKDYLVIDLSGGPQAPEYPMFESTIAPNLEDDACRTNLLWLRRINKGAFTMGSLDGEQLSRTQDGGRFPHRRNEMPHQVELTQTYYIGVYEVTQKQYELVMGGNPSKHLGDMRPVEQVSYDDLRGSSGKQAWPTFGHSVDSVTFFGKLRAKTGLVFDLPTEAQWEYACRAGTTTALNSGKNLTAVDECPNMAEVGRYRRNCSDGKGGYSEHTKVGSYLPNAWGLYDMHGNVWEWCLDWYSDYLLAPQTNPEGPDSSICTHRVVRGGSWKYNYAQNCRSAIRDDIYFPSDRSDDGGFRVVIFLLDK